MKEELITSWLANRLIDEVQGTKVFGLERVDIICAYINTTALGKLTTLFDALQSYFSQGPNRIDECVRIITTFQYGTTEVEAVQALALRGFGVKIFVGSDPNFHAKGWLFSRKDGRHVAIVGSSNLTSSGLTEGVEWNMRVEMDNPGESVKTIQTFKSTFDRFWADKSLMSYTTHQEEWFRQLRKQQTKGGAPRCDDPNCQTCITSRTHLALHRSKSKNIGIPSVPVGSVWRPPQPVSTVPLWANVTPVPPNEGQETIAPLGSLRGLPSQVLPRDGPYSYRLVSSLDGSRLAFVSNYKPFTVKLWNTSSEPSVLLLNMSYPDTIVAATLSRDGQFLALATVGGAVECINTASGQSTFQFTLEDVAGLDFCPDGRLAVLQTNLDGEWFAGFLDKSGHHVKLYFIDGDATIGIAKFEFGKLVCAGMGNAGRIQVWNINNDEFEVWCDFIGDPDSVIAGAISPDGNMIAYATTEMKVNIWNITSKSPLSIHNLACSSIVHRMAFSPNLSILAVVEAEGGIVLWKIDAQPPVSERYTGDTSGIVGNIAFVGNEKLAFVGEGTIIRFVELASSRG